MSESSHDMALAPGLRVRAAQVRAWVGTPGGARWLLALILLVGAYLRLSHLNWDQGTHIHPDERFLTMVSSALALPKSLGQFFDSAASPMNPYNKGYGFFVYGTLPIFIVRVAAELANQLNKTAHLWNAAPGIPLTLIGYDGVHLVGRALSGLFDLAGVALIYVIGRRLYSRKVGLLAAALLTFAVLPLQQSHFYTVDTFATFFALLTFYFAVRVAQGGERTKDEGRRTDDRHPSSVVRRSSSSGGWLTYIALGASLGASLASRINLAPLAAIALLAAIIRLWDDWQRLRAESRSGNGMLIATLVQAALFRLLLLGIATIVVVRVAQPYAFGGSTVLDFSLAPKWLSNMQAIGQLIRGDQDYPPAHQWAGLTPILFPWLNMVIWGMGLPLGLAAWAGWLVALLQVIRGLTRRDKVTRRQGDKVTGWQGDKVTGREDSLSDDVTVSPDHRVTPSPCHPVTTVSPWRRHLLPVAWIGGMFAYHSMQFSFTMRYFLPIYPLLTLLAACGLWWVADWAGERGKEGAGGKGSRGEGEKGSRGAFAFVQKLLRAPAPLLSSVAYALLTAVVIGTMLWGWGFLAIYRRPLSRVEASRWIYANVPAGQVVANEHWDDPLPFSLDGKISFRPAGLYRSLSSSSDGQMQMYNEDTAEKRDLLYRWLNEADVIVMSSNRLWGGIPHLPLRFPMTTRYYQLMAEEKLGFELAARFTSFPTIFGIPIDDTGSEEAFTVYDHPEVRIYRKTPAYSEALARSYLDKVDLESVIPMWPKQVNAAPTALYLTEAEAARQQAGGTWSAIFDENGLLNTSPVAATVAWWLLLVFLGVVAFPITFVALRGLTDRGYGVAKILGILLLAWLSWIGPSLKLVPYTRWWIALCLGLMIGVSAALAWRRRAAIVAYVRSHYALLLTEESLFLILFLLFVLIRVGDPDLWHPARGGEKPMEFAYLNAVIKSTTFPPYDPWHAGGFMNYYYFGFVIVGTLIKLTGIVPWVAYNLAVPAIFALTGLGAFSVAFNLADGDRGNVFPGEEPATQGMRIGPLLAGLAGTFFVAIIGNLGNLELILDQLAARSTLGLAPGATVGNVLSGLFAVLGGKTPFEFPNDWWFWNASRVIPDTINEFPFFTFTYADLHAHMVALPLTLLGLACAVALVRGGGSGTRDQGLGIGDWESAHARQPLVPSPQSPVPTSEPSPWHITLPELLPILLLGLVAGALRATNTWDFPTYLLIGLATLTVLEVTRRSQMSFPDALDERLAFIFRAVVSVVWRVLILAAVATLTFYPYTQNYATAYAGLQLWDGAKTKIGDYLIVHGFFLALAVIYLVSELVAQLGRTPDDEFHPSSFILHPSSLSYIVGAMIVVLAAGLALKAQVWLIALPLAVLATVLACGRDVPPARRLGLLLIALALAITMGVEVVRQKDDLGRMNTVFKFYVQAWTLFGVGTAFGLAGWASRAASWRPRWRNVAWGVTAILFACVMLYPAFAARAKVRDRFSAEASPHGLDGMAYMDQAQYADNGRDLKLADDKQAILWMLRNVAGSPVILEAQTPEYRWGSRFSIYTGLPAVQGWNWHQRQQRSVVPLVVERRVAQVKEIYDTTDLQRAQHLLDTYHVSYIIIGELERAYYAPAGLAKFETLVKQGYLELAYAGGAVRIYQVVGRAEATAAEPVRPVRVGPPPVPTPTPPPARATAPTAALGSSPLPGPKSFESPQK